MRRSVLSLLLPCCFFISSRERGHAWLRRRHAAFQKTECTAVSLSRDVDGEGGGRCFAAVHDRVVRGLGGSAERGETERGVRVERRVRA